MIFPILHIYAQQYYHQDAYIVGNKESLTELRNAINKAIDADSNEQCESSVADGEGYNINIMIVNDDRTFDKLRRPYIDECAKDTRKDAIDPYNMWYNRTK